MAPLSEKTDPSAPSTTPTANPVAGNRKRRARRAQAAPPVETRIVEIAPMATAAKPRKRHWSIMLSFVLFVVLPAAVVCYYMYSVAVDQYESRVGFVVRAEESQSALDVLSGLTGVSSASSSDTDILYEFIQSQEMVQRVNQTVDLRDVFSRPENDPLFALKEGASIEELLAHWQRKVRVYYDGSTGLIEVHVSAFRAEDAHLLAKTIYAEAEQMINALSDVARADATQYAAEERDKAIERLITARQALTSFRLRTQIVDPSADVAGQMGLLHTLQAQLAEVLIEQDLLAQTVGQNDPRLLQLQRRIEVIEHRIAAERGKLGVGSKGGGASSGYAELFGEYERLKVDQEFAETAYFSALSAYDAALSEAQRTNRYLAAYLRPTLAETSTSPDRALLSVLFTGFATILWGIGVLIYYSLRDRR